MRVLAHHEALLIAQAAAGVTVAGIAAMFLSSCTSVKARVDLLRGGTTGSSTAVESGEGNEHVRRVGAEPNQRGQ
jgi:hypothetical protein